jgi:ABC-2 type transport system permease protein
MKNVLAALWSEILKVRKSKIFWITIVFFLFIPVMMGLLVFVQKYPEISGKLGMIGSKAAMMRFGNPDWPDYFKLITQFNAAIGIIGFGFITSWIFGREYSDHTIKDILALVVILWSTLLTFLFFIFAIFIGKIIMLSGWYNELFLSFTHNFIITFLLTLLLITPIAFLACFSRGYLFPLGFLILVLIIANFTGLVGIGPYFPWAIPGIYSAPAGAESIQLGTISYIILILTSLLGLIGTIAWWQFADHK